MPNLFKVSKCTARGRGGDFKYWGKNYPGCVKKYGQGVVEVVRHGANPNKGQPEIKQNVLNEQSNKLIHEGNNMKFKHRLVEEAFKDFGQKLSSGFGAAYDKTKEFAGNNPGAAAGIGGAAAGALYNYLSGGAEDLQLERQGEFDQFRNEEIPNMVRAQQALSQDDFNNYYDAYTDIQDTNPITSFLGDKLPFTDDSMDNARDMTQLRLENPEAFKNIPDPMTHRGDWDKIGDYEMNPRASSENNWTAYQNHLKQTINPTDAEKQEFLDKHPDVEKEGISLKRGVENATRDSYLKGAGTGAALGAGGVFAKRKLDERKAQGY